MVVREEWTENGWYGEGVVSTVRWWI